MPICISIYIDTHAPPVICIITSKYVHQGTKDLMVLNHITLLKRENLYFHPVIQPGGDYRIKCLKHCIIIIIRNS